MKTNALDMLHEEPLFSFKEIAGLPNWDCSPRTVRRTFTRLGVVPAKFAGRVALFAKTNVDAAYRRRYEVILEALGYVAPAKPQRIVTVKEARKNAARKGGRK